MCDYQLTYPSFPQQKTKGYLEKASEAGFSRCPLRALSWALAGKQREHLPEHNGNNCRNHCRTYPHNPWISAYRFLGVNLDKRFRLFQLFYLLHHLARQAVGLRHLVIKRPPAAAVFSAVNNYSIHFNLNVMAFFYVDVESDRRCAVFFQHPAKHLAEIFFHRIHHVIVCNPQMVMGLQQESTLFVVFVGLFFAANGVSVEIRTQDVPELDSLR